MYSVVTLTNNILHICKLLWANFKNSYHRKKFFVTIVIDVSGLSVVIISQYIPILNQCFTPETDDMSLCLKKTIRG